MSLPWSVVGTMKDSFMEGNEQSMKGMSIGGAGNEYNFE